MQCPHGDSYQTLLQKEIAATTEADRTLVLQASSFNVQRARDLPTLRTHTLSFRMRAPFVCLLPNFDWYASYHVCTSLRPKA